VASVYTNRLYIAHALVSDTLTVPDDLRWVATSVFVFYPGGEVAPGYQVVDPVTDATILWDSAEVSAVGVFRIFSGFRQVLLEGTTYDLSALGTPDLTICGYELTLP
jgi:hypothetical protein